MLCSVIDLLNNLENKSHLFYCFIMNNKFKLTKHYYEKTND